MIINLVWTLFMLAVLPAPLAGGNGSFNAVVAPITKDPLTSLFTIDIHLHHHNHPSANLLFDISSPLTWSTLPNPQQQQHDMPVPSNSKLCAAARAFSPANCRPSYAGGACFVDVSPPATGKASCNSAMLAFTSINVSTTDGQRPNGVATVPKFAYAAAVAGVLPKGTSGVVGFARSDLGAAQQVSSAMSLKKQFAMCLPSTSSAAGAVFVGDKPFYILPPTLLEATSILSYTPLLLKRPLQDGYFIDLRGIAVGGVALRLSSTGGGAKLTTAIPYTSLATGIYRPFVAAFRRATASVPRMPAVPPFELCFNSSSLGFSRLGYVVPQIDLVLAGGKNWTIFGANSVKQVAGDTACLAFVDGGSGGEAVAVGGFQMEDNFLVFDLEKERLGFSSTLLFIRTTCGNINSTAAAVGA